jgi:hypothetical protein
MPLPAHLEGLIDLVVEAVVRDIEAESQMKTAPPTKASAVSKEDLKCRIYPNSGPTTP